MNPKAVAVRRRLLTDFAFYAKTALQIRTKEGEILPLTLNRAQQYLFEKTEAQRKATGRVRAVILKGRQQGMSTGIGGRLIFNASQKSGRKALVVAHKDDSTRALFDMTRRFYDLLPEALKPAKSYSSRRELAFDKLESSFVVATAGGGGIARGETLQYLHASEVAFWAKSSAAENFNAIMKAVPNAEDTEVYVESTANGATGLFYDLWQGAVAGTNGFVPVFVPWFWTPEYRLKAPEGFERTPEEEKLVSAYALDDDQLFWRRREIATNGLDLFRQEYPCHPDEAFLVTGRPVFDAEQVADMLRSAPPPTRRMTLDVTGTTFEDSPQGELHVFEEPDVAGSYTIGADVAMGVRGGDYSVAQVLDGDKRQVAIWRGHVHPDYFGTVLNALGRWYGDALIAVESNNHGLLTVVRLAKDLEYPDVYTETVVDKTTDRETVKLGFATTAKSKPLIIDGLRAALRKREIDVRDRATIDEMRTFVVTDAGKLEAESGRHDDTVMALAIANFVHQAPWVPIINEDSWFVQAV